MQNDGKIYHIIRDMLNNIFHQDRNTYIEHAYLNDNITHMNIST